MPDVAGAWGVRPSVGPGVWGCTEPEGRAAVVSVGVAVCAYVGGQSSGVCTWSAAGRSGVPWCGRGSGWACVAAAWLAAGRGPCAGATGGVRGVGLPVGLWAGSLCGCAVPGGCSGWVPTAPVFVGLGSGRMMWTACLLHCVAAGPFVATGNMAFVSSRVIHSPLWYLARRMAPTAHFSCSTSPASRTHSSATLARADISAPCLSHSGSGPILRVESKERKVRCLLL